MPDVFRNGVNPANNLLATTRPLRLRSELALNAVWVVLSLNCLWLPPLGPSSPAPLRYSYRNASIGLSRAAWFAG